jgi:hypothetical protein
VGDLQWIPGRSFHPVGPGRGWGEPLCPAFTLVTTTLTPPPPPRACLVLHRTQNTERPPHPPLHILCLHGTPSPDLSPLLTSPPPSLSFYFSHSLSQVWQCLLPCCGTRRSTWFIMGFKDMAQWMKEVRDLIHCLDQLPRSGLRSGLFLS